MNQKLIVIDGKTYNSVNEMPPDVRAKYEQAMAAMKDSNSNDFPNFVENTQPAVISNMMKFIVDGKEYNSIEDLPPKARAKYEQAMGTLDKNNNGMPDFLEGMMGMTTQASAQQASPMTTSPRQTTPQPASPTVTPDTSNGWMLALTGGFILLLCLVGIAGVWYFFFQ